MSQASGKFSVKNFTGGMNMLNMNTLRYEKTVQSVKTFTLRESGKFITLQIRDGIIIAAGPKGCPDWHNLDIGSKDWKKVAEVMVKFYHEDEEKFFEILELLNKEAEEYQHLKKCMKASFEEVISRLQMAVKEHEGVLNEL